MGVIRSQRTSQVLQKTSIGSSRELSSIIAGLLTPSLSSKSPNSPHVRWTMYIRTEAFPVQAKPAADWLVPPLRGHLLGRGESHGRSSSSWAGVLTAVNCWYSVLQVTLPPPPESAWPDWINCLKNLVWSHSWPWFEKEVGFDDLLRSLPTWIILWSWSRWNCPGPGHFLLPHIQRGLTLCSYWTGSRYTLFRLENLLKI